MYIIITHIQYYSNTTFIACNHFVTSISLHATQLPFNHFVTSVSQTFQYTHTHTHSPYLSSVVIVQLNTVVGSVQTFHMIGDEGDREAYKICTLLHYGRGRKLYEQIMQTDTCTLEPSIEGTSNRRSLLCKGHNIRTFTVCYYAVIILINKLTVTVNRIPFLLNTYTV